MNRLILTRHGQTEWNIERWYQGQTDTELTVFGRQQMGGTIDVVRGACVTRVVTSPLKRARESAEIVAAGLGLEVEIEERFREMYLGAWEGKSYSLGRSGEEWFESAPHGGETGAQFRGRIQSWLDENIQDFHVESYSENLERTSTSSALPASESLNTGSDGTVLLVVHGLVVQVILSILLEEEFETWHRRPIKNGAITILSQQDWGWRLEAFNK